jgi:PAS domain S-box-containing protein
MILVAHAPGQHGFPVKYAARDAPPAELAGLSPAAQIVMGLDGVILDFDAGAEALLGYSRDEAVGRRMSEVVVPLRLRAAHEAGLRRYRETGEAPLLRARFELPALCRDGTEVTVDMVVTGVMYEGREAFVGRLRAVDRPTAIPAELHLRAEFYHAVLERSPIMVAVVDENGVLTWRSPDVGALVRAEPGRGLAEQLETLIHPSDLDRAREALRRVTEGVDEAVELRVRAEDGSWRAVSLVTRNLLDHPAVHGTVFYASDVSRARTAERQTRVEAARLMTLIESLNVAVLLQDENRRVVLANAAFVEMFALGVAPERLRGTAGASPLAALYADAEDVERRTEAAIRRGRPLRGEEIRLIDGRVVERDYVPIMMDGSALGYLWVFRDVTAQAQIRRGLEERARMLSDLATLKTEFVAVVSHELRTPLTSINTFANMLEDEGVLDPDERGAAMTAIRRNADRMLSLVADLILLAKLESGELILETGPVDMSALTRRAAAASDGGHVDLEVELTDGMALDGDGKLLAQLTDTAIGVVVAGSSPGAKVAVRAERRPDTWRLSVTTSAADAATAERLLSTRLPHPDAVNERRTGALAVMLARAIATRHGGTLTVEMRNPGVALTIDLPAAAR